MKERKQSLAPVDFDSASVDAHDRIGIPSYSEGLDNMPTRPSPGRLLATPENRSALAAIQDVLEALTSGESASLPNPLYLHGPSGAGKSFLLNALTHELMPAGVEVCSLSANDFADKGDFTDAQSADLLVVEDLQHLPVRCQPTLLRLIDARLRHDGLMIFTALQGPGRLTHRGTPVPRRLANRLAAGLVVDIPPMGPTSRRRLLDVLAQDVGVPVAAEILDWLAKHLIGGGRQLHGAIRQLRTLQHVNRKPLSLETVRHHFRAQLDATGPAVKQIAERVSSCFDVPPGKLASAKRSHDVLLPRQVSMYLARSLTGLSLQQIGKYFGGRDHKTVQHACKKVEAALKTDAALSSTVRQLRAELT